MAILRFLGRVFFSSLVLAAYNHYANFARDAGTIKAQLNTLNIPVPFPELPQVLMGATIFLQAAGGLLLALGLESLGATFLAMFLLPTTLIMHAFWAEKTAPKQAEQMGTFVKNVALLGGALYILASQRVYVVRNKQKTT